MRKPWSHKAWQRAALEEQKQMGCQPCITESVNKVKFIGPGKRLRSTTYQIAARTWSSRIAMQNSSLPSRLVLCSNWLPEPFTCLSLGSVPGTGVAELALSAGPRLSSVLEPRPPPTKPTPNATLPPCHSTRQVCETIIHPYAAIPPTIDMSPFESRSYLAIRSCKPHPAPSTPSFKYYSYPPKYVFPYTPPRVRWT